MTQTLELLQGEAEKMQARIDIDASTIAQQQAEVARLRQMYQDALRTVSSSNQACEAERAAHEATKTDLATAQQRKRLIAEQRDAAEARVAELTEKQYKAAALLIDAQQAAHAAEAALDQARGLLDKASDAIDEACYPVWWSGYRAWLRAHPAPATPAATWAETCPGCGREYKHCPSAGDECWRNNGCPPPLAEKEQGT